MAYWKAKNNPTPAKQTSKVHGSMETLNVQPGSAADHKTKIAEAKEEEIAQQSKAEGEGQQIIGQVDRGEISQEEGNAQLKILQDAQNNPQ